MNESTNPQPVKQFAQWIVHWRWPVLIASLVLAMMAAAGAPRLAFNNEYRVFSVMIIQSFRPSRHYNVPTPRSTTSYLQSRP